MQRLGLIARSAVIITSKNFFGNVSEKSRNTVSLASKLTVFLDFSETFPKKFSLNFSEIVDHFMNHSLNLDASQPSNY